MKQWKNRLNRLESQLFLTRPQAEELVGILLSAAQHHARESVETLAREFAACLVTAFRGRILLGQAGMATFCDTLIAIIRQTVLPEQSRTIGQALRPGQGQRETHA